MLPLTVRRATWDRLWRILLAPPAPHPEPEHADLAGEDQTGAPSEAACTAPLRTTGSARTEAAW